MGRVKSISESSVNKKIDINALGAQLYLQEIQAFFQKTPLFLSENRKFYREKINTFSKKRTPYYELWDYKCELLDQNLSELSSQKIKDLYEKFQIMMNKVAKYELGSEGTKLRKLEDSEGFKNLVIQVYENQADIEFSLSYIMSGRHTRKDLNKAIKELTTNPSKLNPVTPGNPLKALIGMFGVFYDPQKKSNIPHIKKFGDSPVTCLHFGNQTYGTNTVYPIFKLYLKVKRERNPGKKYPHLYFNLMKHHSDSTRVKKHNVAKRKKNEFIEKSEGKRVKKLHDELDCIISLPADNAFFLKDFSMVYGSKKKTMSEGFDSLMISIRDAIRDDTNDFLISPDMKKEMFGDLNDRDGHERFRELFVSAAKEMFGYPIPNKFTLEERQAIFFHFIKHTITNHAIVTFKPESYNVTCKVAMDRGAAHSLWNNLNLRYNEGNPLSQMEFLMHLHAPALLVENRLMNKNQNLLWLAFHTRLKHDPKFANAHVWALEWVKTNKPKKWDTNVSWIEDKQDKLLKFKRSLNNIYKTLEMFKQINKVNSKKEMGKVLQNRLSFFENEFLQDATNYIDKMLKDQSIFSFNGETCQAEAIVKKLSYDIVHLKGLLKKNIPKELLDWTRQLDEQFKALCSYVNYMEVFSEPANEEVLFSSSSRSDSSDEEVAKSPIKSKEEEKEPEGFEEKSDFDRVLEGLKEELKRFVANPPTKNVGTHSMKSKISFFDPVAKVVAYIGTIDLNQPLSEKEMRQNVRYYTLQLKQMVKPLNNKALDSFVERFEEVARELEKQHLSDKKYKT